MADFEAVLVLFVTITLFPPCYGFDRYPSPLLFAKFNGNTRDLTGRNPDATLGSAVTYTEGPYGEENGAIFLDGSSDSHVTWPNGDGGPLTFEQDMTFITWVRNTGSEKGIIFGYTGTAADDNVHGWELYEWNEEAKLLIRMVFDDGSQTDQYVDDAMPMNVWTQLALTYQYSTGKHILYKDGVVFWYLSTQHSKNFDTSNLRVRMGKRTDAVSAFKGAFACVQLYDVFMSYNEISKVSSLCNPEYMALNPWPVPLAIWPLNHRFGTEDIKSTPGNNDITAVRAYLESGPSGGHSGSYQITGGGYSYLEIDNSDHAVSPLNGYTFTFWIYQTDESIEYPFINYEYGTEEGGTNNWAAHIWLLSGVLYATSSAGVKASTLTLSPYQWNFVGFSYDFLTTDQIRFTVNDQTDTQILESDNLKLWTDLASRIRMGRTFFDPDERYAQARFSCLQVYDLPMSFDEVAALRDRCDIYNAGLDGNPPGLVLMYPFNKQHDCRSTVPLGQTQNIENSACNLVAGPRARHGEALRITKSGISSSHVVLRPSFAQDGFASELSDQTSSYTLMFYIRLDNETNFATKIGFLKSDDDMSDTWMMLNTNGSLTLNLGGLATTDADILVLYDVYLPTETAWIHLAVTCNRWSARCYLFMNGSFIGESAEDLNNDWHVSTSLFIELSSEDVNASTDISCLQLYNRVLSQGEITLSKDRCTINGDQSRPPLPVGFWPLDKVYRHRELTGRSRDLILGDSVLFSDDGPFLSTQGAASFEEGVDSFGVIPVSPGTNMRHSFTLQMYLKFNSSTATGRSFPLFLWASEDVGRYSSIYIVKSTDDETKFQVQLAKGVQDIITDSDFHTVIPVDRWVRLAVTFNFITGKMKLYVNRALVNEQKVLEQTELMSAADVWIGKQSNDTDADGISSLTCIQLYDIELNSQQLDQAAMLCDYHLHSHFEKPVSVLPGWTQQHMNSTAVVRSKVVCMQACISDSQCLALNFYSESGTCELSTLTLRDTSLVTFQNTGGLYLEKVHPLIAQGL